MLFTSFSVKFSQFFLSLLKIVLFEIFVDFKPEIPKHLYFSFSQQLHAKDKEYGVASELLALGVESTDETNATYVKVLFLLSRAMILLIDRKLNDVLGIFHQASIVIENSIQNLHLKEYLKVFYLVLQVSLHRVWLETNKITEQNIFSFIRCA